MDTQIRRIMNTKYTLTWHLVADISLLLYCITYFFSGDGSMIMKYIVAALYVLICMATEITNYRSKFKFLTEYTMYGRVFFILRPIVDLIFYYLSFTKLEGNIFLIHMLMTVIELVFYMSLGQTMRKVAIYILFALSYGLASIVMIVILIQNEDSRLTPMVSVREILTILVVVMCMIMVGEIISVMWDYFEKQILKQNRALEDLNEANDALHEHQEKINKINEKLGIQKIEMLEANKKINRSHDEMSVQNEISSAIASSVGKDEMLKRVAGIMQIRLDMDLVAIIMEENKDLLAPGESPTGRYLALASMLGESFDKNFTESVTSTDLKELLMLSQTYVQNTETDSVCFFTKLTKDQKLPSMIILPIVNQKERMGTLVVAKNKINVFMDSRAFYENIASQIGIGIANARLYDKMNDMAIRDGLTRIYNRGHLTELLNGYLSEAISRKITLSLVLFDIDKFKSINDTYGHQCGDEVLIAVAALLNKGAIANGGIAGRYGGEEFVIAFLGKGLQETHDIVKDIHEQIRHIEVPYDGNIIQVRASAGIASYPGTCADPGELLTRADMAMYYSKEHGRDRITVDSEEVRT